MTLVLVIGGVATLPLEIQNRTLRAERIPGVLGLPAGTRIQYEWRYQRGVTTHAEIHTLTYEIVVIDPEQNQGQMIHEGSVQNISLTTICLPNTTEGLSPAWNFHLNAMRELVHYGDSWFEANTGLLMYYNRMWTEILRDVYRCQKQIIILGSSVPLPIASWSMGLFASLLAIPILLLIFYLVSRRRYR